MSSVTTPAGRRASRSADSEVSGGTGYRAASRATYLLVLILFSLFAWAPLLYPGYLQVHSGFLPIFNLADLAESSNKLSWLPAIGGGREMLRGDGPLAYGLALVLRPLAGDLGAVKGVFALCIVIGGLGVAAWTRRGLAGWAEPSGLALAEGGNKSRPYADVAERAGLLAAVVFMLWPPLLATVYVRGGFAETVAFALVPWALVGVSGVRYRMPDGRDASRFIAGMVGTAFVVASLFFAQAGLAVWAIALLVIWAVWPGAPARSRGIAAGAVLVGAAAGLGVLWLLHGGIAGGGQAGDMAAHAVYPYQLVSPAWSFGISTPDWKGDLPLQLGLAALSLAMMAVVLGVGSSRNRSGQSHAEARSNTDDGVASSTPAEATPAATPGRLWQSAMGFSLIAGLVLIVLMTTVARPLWTGVPALAGTLTYPWQLVVLVGPLLAFLAGALLVVERRLALLPMIAGLLAFVVLSSAPAMSPRLTQVDPGPAPAAIFGADQVTLLTAEASFDPGLSSADASSTLQPLASIPLTVTLTWQALAPVDVDYNLFVHLLDAAGTKVAQWDGQPPLGGDPYPMTQWQVGEIVPSTIRLDLTAEQAAAVRQVVVGLYDWQTGARLAAGGDDKVVIEPSAGPGSEVAP